MKSYKNKKLNFSGDSYKKNNVMINKKLIKKNYY